jgi:HSP20 family protein
MRRTPAYWRGTTPQVTATQPKGSIMNALTQFERFDDLLPTSFGDSLRRVLRGVDWPAMRAPSDMKVDVSEKDDAYQIRAEIPGAKKEDLKVSIDGNRVSIEAEVKEEKETKGDGGRNLVRELYYGQMSRSFTLGCDLDDGRTEAKFENGILSLTVPKREGGKQKLIKVS